jgi:hypothetical protein
MLSTNKTALSRPVRWGLAEKPFTTLILMGATAVLVTAVLGIARQSGLEERGDQDGDWLSRRDDDCRAATEMQQLS